jgi:hypothetical protein
MEDANQKTEESSLGDELYGDKNVSPNAFAQPNMGVQAAIERLLDTQSEE